MTSIAPRFSRAHGSLGISLEEGDDRSKYIYKSAKGTEFEIYFTQSGLYGIKMNSGGKTPRICEERFTSYKKAQAVLESYLRENDPVDTWVAENLGEAVYPSKKETAREKAARLKKERVVAEG